MTPKNIVENGGGEGGGEGEFNVILSSSRVILVADGNFFFFCKMQSNLNNMYRCAIYEEDEIENTYIVLPYIKKTRFGELIIFEPWRENHHFSQTS